MIHSTCVTLYLRRWMRNYNIDVTSLLVGGYRIGLVCVQPRRKNISSRFTIRDLRRIYTSLHDLTKRANLMGARDAGHLRRYTLYSLASL